MYSVERRGLRVASSDRCLLVCDGGRYSAKLENISVSGALLTCIEGVPAGLAPGDTCGMVLCSDPVLCPGVFTSRVARRDASKIALEFLDIKF